MKATDVENAPSAQSPATTTGGRLKGYLFGAPRLHLIVIAVLVIIVLVQGVWGFFARRNAASELSDQRTALVAKARTALVDQTHEVLALSAQPLAWALRAEMLAGDDKDLTAYMAKLAQLPNVRRVVVFDDTNKVVASTNMKFQGKQLAEVFPELPLAGTEPQVTATAEDLRIIVPIMGFDRKIGTAVLDYAQSAIDSKLAF